MLIRKEPPSDILDELKKYKPSDTDQAKRRTPSDADIEKIYNGIRHYPGLKSYKRVFEECLLTLLLKSAIRINEAFNIHMEDIDLEKRILFIRQGKGGKTREIGINQALYESLTNFINVRSNIL